MQKCLDVFSDFLGEEAPHPGFLGQTVQREITLLLADAEQASRSFLLPLHIFQDVQYKAFVVSAL